MENNNDVVSNVEATEDVEAELINLEEVDNLIEEDGGSEEIKDPVQPKLEWAITELNLSYNEPNHYKKQCFYSCINLEKQEQIDERDSLKKELQDIHVEKLFKIEIYHKQAIERIKEKIGKEKKYLLEEEETWAESLNDLEEKLKKEETVLAEIQEEIIDKFNEYGKKREEFIVENIKGTKKALQELTDSHKELFESREKFSGKIFKEKENANNQRINYLKSLLDRVNKRYDLVIEKITMLNVQGVSPMVYNFLISIGFVAATASGWFFSIYAKEKDLASENTLFFILKGIFRFGETLDKDGAWYSPWIMLGGFLVIIALISFIVFITDDRRKDENNDDLTNLALELGNKKSSPFLAVFKADSVAAFWKQILPAVVVSGLVVIALFLARQGLGEKSTLEDLNALDISLSAQLMGTAIALAMSGIVYLYVIKIVEIRISKDQGGNNFLSNNIELVVVLGGLILFMLVNVFIGASIEKINISLVAFLFTGLLSAICISYGYRYKGLLMTENYLLWKKSTYSERLKRALYPNNDELLTNEDHLFNKQFLKLTGQLYQLVEAKNNLSLKEYKVEKESVKKHKGNKPKETIPKKENRIFRIIRNTGDYILGRNKPSGVEEPEISDETIQPLGGLELFPYFTISIQALRDKEQNVKDKITYLRRRITTKKNRRFIRDIRNRINNMKKAIEKRENRIIEETNVLNNRLELIFLHVDDGFDLARWYSNNHLENKRINNRIGGGSINKQLEN